MNLKALKVCKECFNDDELRGYIISQKQSGECSFCQQDSENTIDLYELKPFFEELLICFQPAEAGNSLVDIIQHYWNFFKNHEVGTQILNHILPITKSKITDGANPISFAPQIIESIYYWEELKNELKTETRYFSKIKDITIYDFGWDTFFDDLSAITHNNTLFRARLHHKANEKCYEKKNMYSPPPELATAGRANPLGIPFLYLCDNIETTLYEIRASYLDEASVASFKLEDNVETLLISDFTISPDLYKPGSVDTVIKSTLLKEEISKDLSKPLRRYDSEVDYIPTQYICEFIKETTLAKGIKFRSSLYNKGNNIVIFDQELMLCTNVEKYRVENVTIEGRKILQPSYIQ